MSDNYASVKYGLTMIAEQFNLENRAQLWALRTYHGKLKETFCHPTGRLEDVTPEHADRLIAAGQNVYVDVPCDPNGPEGPWRCNQFGIRPETAPPVGMQPAASLQPDDRMELLLVGEPDREYETRIEAQRVTLQMAQRSQRRQAQHEDSPLFGGPRQNSLF